TAIMGSASAIGENRAKEAIVAALDSPLLNDNKIAGAKNVLLLIVSGTSEITIDEIGEINDYIQSEAGHNANIIMGVGEDDTLGESIAVTVIATGFNIDQQTQIVNTEPKKIIHALEGEQKLERDLSAAKPAAFDFLTTPESAPANPEPARIVFELTEETKPEIPQMDLIPTSEFIKNLDVVFEVLSPVKDLDFTITTPQIREINVNDPVLVREDQVTLDFELPIAAEIEKESQSLSFDVSAQAENIKVNEAVEMVPV